MSPRPRSRNFRKPADLISNPNITEPRPPPELGPKFVLAWVPRRSLGYPHVGADSRDYPGMEPPYHSLPAGRYQLEVVFSRPMDRQSVEETLAQRLGQTLLPHWVWLDDRTARFTVNLARPVIVDFHGAKGRDGVTIWELWTMNLRGREPRPVAALDPHTGAAEERFRVPISPCQFVVPSPDGGMVLMVENRGSGVDACPPAPLLADTGDPFRTARRIAGDYAGAGPGSWRPFWASDGSRVYIAGGVVALAGHPTPDPGDAALGDILPDAVHAGPGVWVGWALDPESDRLAALWMEDENARLHPVISRDGTAMQHVNNLGYGDRDTDGVRSTNSTGCPAGRRC